MNPTPETVSVTLPSCLLGLDFTQPPPIHQTDLAPFIPHSANDYQSNFALEKSMEALMASFGATPSHAESLPVSPCTPAYQHSLDGGSGYDINGQLVSPVDPSTYAAWSTFEATTPNYFPENPLDFVPQAPMSAPAAYSAFNFGPVGSPFEQYPQPSSAGAYSFALSSTSAAGSLEAFEPYNAGSSSSSPYPTFSLPALSDMASPTTTESSSLPSPGAAYSGEQLQAPFEMQWERAEGGCGGHDPTMGEEEYKRRFSAQWTGQQGEHVGYYAQPGIQEEFVH